MRKLLVVSSMLCALLPFKAAFADVPVSVYVGLGGGVDLLSVNRDRIIPPFVNPAFPPPNPMPLTQSFSNDDHGSGGVGMAFVGAMCRFNRFAVAGELTGVLDDTTAKATVTNFLNGPPGQAPIVSVGVRERMQNSFFVSVLPGFYLNENTEVFGRVGYANGNLKVSSTQGSGGSLGLTGSQSKSLSGYVVGLGVKTSVTKSVDFRLEYDYVHYNSLTVVTPQSLVFGLGTVTSTYKPASNMVTASLIYHFDFG